jgi:uncharacterized membrane protein YfcA
MDTTNLIVFVIVFFAIFTQSVSGFGLALVSMPILADLIGIRTTTPLIALVAIIAEIVLLIRYQNEINLQNIWRLTAAGAVGIPLGVVALKVIDEEIVLTVLGIFILIYAIYALLKLKLPSLEGNIWPVGFGFVSGVIGGAYNVAGPLVIVYGNCRRWQPKEFKGNLQGFFLMGSVLAVTSHALANNITNQVLNLFFLSLPAIAMGLIAGLSLDKYLNPTLFRKIVLVGLAIAGLRLVIS